MVSNHDPIPSSVDNSQYGRVVVSVRTSQGEPVVRCHVSRHPRTPVRVTSMANYTNPSGTVTLGLLPATYVLRVHDTQGMVRGESADVKVEAGKTAAVTIIFI
jgi:hypothetical protein